MGSSSTIYTCSKYVLGVCCYSLLMLCAAMNRIVQGGIFSLKLQFSERYPEKPPRVRFTCDMFHPNVYSDGNICMDTIQDKWSPCHNICTVLMSIQSLLTDPNCSSPANPEAAQLYIKDKKAYNRRVRRMAEKSVENC
eukprot:GHRR01007414.1.p1 GENE.GHRR01007414.1~~GHRR01007414.1.p1  ORF type:complete len:138 (+),score=33.08 GHRR01007414.1:562-975(+)